MSSALRNKLLTSFSMYGYTLSREALQFLLSCLEPFEESKRSNTIEKILDFVQSQALDSPLIEKSILEQASNELLSDNASVDADHLKVIDSFSVPAYIYNDESKKFVLRSSVASKLPSLFGDPDSRRNIFLDRYKLVLQRTSRHRLFLRPAAQIAADSSSDVSFSLTSIENLLGIKTSTSTILLLGMLTQLKEGQMFLEDPTGAVKVNLSQASYKKGLFPENSVVLAEGCYEDGVFHVSAVGFPPPESASATLSHFPYLSVSSTTESKSHRLSEKLKIMEEKLSDSMFIFLSDVWLDELKIMQKLEILLAGYSQHPPTCFVLIGNFLSLPNVHGKNKALQECFEKLGNMINNFPGLVSKSVFVFVPGADDPGSPAILPRPPLPETLISEFRKKVPNAVFTTNPCRIQYCTQEIVVFREDMMLKMCRNSIYVPWQDEEKVDIPSLFVKTIIANSHLLPLPLNAAPVYWEFDHALGLYPLPDLVVFADKSDPYTVHSTGAIFTNPGSLAQTNFSFKVYIPATRHLEDCEITDDQIS